LLFCRTGGEYSTLLIVVVILGSSALYRHPHYVLPLATFVDRITRSSQRCEVRSIPQSRRWEVCRSEVLTAIRFRSEIAVDLVVSARDAPIQVMQSEVSRREPAMPRAKHTRRCRPRILGAENPAGDFE